MIIFLTTRHHAYTVTSLLHGGPDGDLPECHALAYDDLFTLDRLPAATYIFADIERLTPWERCMAAVFHRALREAGHRCLNDPARLLTRYALLRALHAAGFNPFRAWRLDEGLAEAARFPLFLRFENDHRPPASGLIESRQALEEALRQLAWQGIPTSLLIATEFCSEPIAPGIWRKHGSLAAAGRVETIQVIIEDSWCVKYGTAGLSTDAMFEAEFHAIDENRYGAVVAPAFAIGAIDWGRADHATVDGREVVYEINTNPNFGRPTETHRSARHLDAERRARARIADLLWSVEGQGGSAVAIPEDYRRSEYRKLGRRIFTYAP